MKLHSIFALLAVTATLAACGGGGSGDAPAPAPEPSSTGTDKFVGTWGRCSPVTGSTNGILSGRNDFVFTKTSATVMDLSVNYVYFKTTDCSGTVANTVSGVGNAIVTINGAKLIGTQVVDRLNLLARSATVSEFNGSLKDIALISGNSLTFGADSAADTNGYATALDTTTVFTKQ
jgi:hypothetical protein